MGLSAFPSSPEYVSVRVWFQKELSIEYSKLIQKITRGAKKEHKQAQELSEFFTYVNQLVGKSTNQNAYDTLVREYFGEMDIESYLPKEAINSAFVKNSDEWWTTYGNRFEEELSGIISNFMQTSLENSGVIDIGAIDVFTGHNKANPKNYDKIVENMKITLETKAFKEAGDKVFSDGNSEYVTKNQGSFKNEKIDIDVASATKRYPPISLMSLGGTKKLDSVLNILKDATFTVKTASKDSAHLGNTNLYKIYVANLSQMTSDASTINQSFLRAMVCLNEHKKVHQDSENIITPVLQKMSQVYELTGYGLTDIKNDSGLSSVSSNRFAKFILIKSTYHYKVMVESTKYELLNNISNIATSSIMSGGLTHGTSYIF